LQTVLELLQNKKMEEIIMKLKRILSAALAGAMSMTLVGSALAAESKTEITATYKEAEIAVTVPGTIDAFINPYGVDVNYDASDDSKVLSGFQSLSKPECIYNKSAMNLSVSASVTGEVTGPADATKAMKFATASTDGASITTKSAYVVFQMKVDNTLKDFETADADTVATQAQAWAADDNDSSIGEVIVKAGETVGEDLIILNAGKEVSNKMQVAEGGAALIRLNGDCVTAPKIGWTTDDTFKVTVVYTFMPTDETSPLTPPVAP